MNFYMMICYIETNIMYDFSLHKMGVTVEKLG
jgi:hypothetical protein